LADGLALVNLLEVISDKKIPNYNKRPKIRPQMLENNSFALNFLKNEGIKLVAIGPEGSLSSFVTLIRLVSFSLLYYLFSVISVSGQLKGASVVCRYCRLPRKAYLGSDLDHHLEIPNPKGRR